MQRVQRLGWLLFAVFALSSRPAEAGVPDWLEELSGAGPFWTDGLSNFVATALCFHNPSDAQPVITFSQSDKVKDPCVFVDYHHLLNGEDDKFYAANGHAGKELRVTAISIGVAFQPWEGAHTDFGIDTGSIRFHTTRGATNVRSDTSHKTVGFRAQMKPLLFLPLFRADRVTTRFPPPRKWASVPKVYVRRSAILGTLSGDKDFGVPGSTYARKNEWVWSIGGLLDFTELWRP